MPDEGTAPAPQEQGQGTDGNEGGGLYDSILEGVPNEYHQALTEKLKSKDADFTKRFQQTSERWKPYEELGVADYEPEELGGWLNLSKAINGAMEGDDKAKEQVKEWWEGAGEELGFYESGDNADNGDGPTDLLDLSPDQLQKMISEQVGKAISPVQEHLTKQEEAQALAEAKQQTQEQLTTLRTEHPNLTDEDQEDILAFAFVAGQDNSVDDPIAAGFEKFKRIASKGENDLFGTKLDQPSPAEGSGLPNTNAPVPNSENAKELALERLRQVQAT